MYSLAHNVRRQCFLGYKTLNFVDFYMQIYVHIYFYMQKNIFLKKCENLAIVAKFWKWTKTLMVQEKSIFRLYHMSLSIHPQFTLKNEWNKNFDGAGKKHFSIKSHVLKHTASVYPEKWMKQKYPNYFKFKALFWQKITLKIPNLALMIIVLEWSKIWNVNLSRSKDMIFSNISC